MWVGESVEIQEGLRDYERFQMREKVNKVLGGWVRMRVGVEIWMDLKDYPGFQVREEMDQRGVEV